jgi:hypothetical protein
MDDHIARVDQHPVAGLLAFDPGRQPEGLLQPLGQLFRDRATCRDDRPEADHHVIAIDRAPAQVDLHDLFGLVVVKLLEDMRQKVFARTFARGGTLVMRRHRPDRQPGRIRMRQDIVLQKLRADRAPALGTLPR